MFGLDAWIIWLIIGVIFIISEIFTVGFVMMPLGLAALASSLIAKLLPESGLGAQLVAFIVAGIILIFFGQKLASKLSKDPDIKVGAERLIGLDGIVLERIDPAKNTGLVRVTQEEWRAKSEDETIIEKGEKITVVQMDGTHLNVKKQKS
jgi:membrane protein implicated in regulation of membrane protease activity